MPNSLTKDAKCQQMSLNGQESHAGNGTTELRQGDGTTEQKPGNGTAEQKKGNGTAEIKQGNDAGKKQFQTHSLNARSSSTNRNPSKFLPPVAKDFDEKCETALGESETQELYNTGSLALTGLPEKKNIVHVKPIFPVEKLPIKSCMKHPSGSKRSLSPRKPKPQFTTQTRSLYPSNQPPSRFLPQAPKPLPAEEPDTKEIPKNQDENANQPNQKPEKIKSNVIDKPPTENEKQELLPKDNIANQSDQRDISQSLAALKLLTSNTKDEHSRPGTEQMKIKIQSTNEQKSGDAGKEHMFEDSIKEDQKVEGSTKTSRSSSAAPKSPDHDHKPANVGNHQTEAADETANELDQSENILQRAAKVQEPSADGKEIDRAAADRSPENGTSAKRRSESDNQDNSPEHGWSCCNFKK